MKPPVPGEMLRRRNGSEVEQALFIQHIDEPTAEWLADVERLDEFLTEYQGVPKGWWYVLVNDELTSWMPPHHGDDKVYIYDGSRWRWQRYVHVYCRRDQGLDDLSVPNPDEDEQSVTQFELIEEVYLPEGEGPPF